MECREGDVIISVDRGLTEEEDCFVRGTAAFVMGVLVKKQSVEASLLMFDVTLKLI